MQRTVSCVSEVRGDESFRHSCTSNNLQGVCSNCHPQLDWRCSDTTCINNTQVCDGREDCSDGGDEQYCNFICFNMQTIEMKVGCVLELSTKI